VISEKPNSELLYVIVGRR